MGEAVCSLRPLEPEGPVEVVYLTASWSGGGNLGQSFHFSAPPFPHLNKGDPDMLCTSPSLETIIIV